MKKKILSLTLVAVMLFGAMLTLAGCGDDKEGGKQNKITDSLNKVVSASVDRWEKDGYAHIFTMSDIQSSLDNKYVIIACGDKEFTKAPSVKKFTESISDYAGTSCSNTRGLEKDYGVDYCVVLDTSAQKYYNIEISYKTKNLNGTEKEYPYFQNAKEIK